MRRSPWKQRDLVAAFHAGIFDRDSTYSKRFSAVGMQIGAVAGLQSTGSPFAKHCDPATGDLGRMLYRELEVVGGQSNRMIVCRPALSV